MYSPERVQWWLSRTQSRDHQAAYDAIVSRISSSARVIIDHCCGNAELLKRIYQRYIASANKVNDRKELPLLIGTEITSEMLKLAAENLRASGIESLFLTDATNIMKHRGIVLLEYNFTDSHLPPEISDVSLLTFPELALKIDTPIAEEIISRYNPKSDTELKLNIANYWISRVTKRGRQVFVCDYASYAGKGSTLERVYLRKEAELGRRFGLHLIGAPFTPSAEVFGDTPDFVQARVKTANTKSGYRILMYVKT